MRPHKYPVIVDREQEYFNIELARVGSGDNRVPVVAAQHGGAGIREDHIALFWWNAGAVNSANPGGSPCWQSHLREVEHRENFYRDDSWNAVPDLTSSGLWNYSRRVSLAGDANQLFLCYKNGTDYWLDHFSWDEPACELIRNFDEPARIPLPQFGYLYTGLIPQILISPSTDQLLLLFQTAEEDHPQTPLLVLYSFDLSQGLSRTRFVDFNHWQTTILVPGGYDLDVLLADPLLHIVHQEQPFGISIPTSDLAEGLNHISVSSLPAESFLALDYLAYDLGSNEIVNQAKLPGGMHPRFQSLDPLLITADRPGSGHFSLEIEKIVNTMDINDPEHPDWTISVETIQKTFSNGLRQMEKILIRYDPDDQTWRAAGFLPYRQDLLPRGFVDGIQEQIQIENDHILWGTLFSIKPVALAATQREQPHTWGEIYDFLHHDAENGCLMIDTFRVTREPDQLHISASGGSTIVDINHAQIPAHDLLVPEGTPENDQFSPFEDQPEPDEYQDGNFIHQKLNYIYDNTIGGALAAERGSLPLHFYAYTDLGDGGLRVIFDEELEIPDLIPADDIKLDPAAVVSGPGSAADVWIELPFPDGPLPYQLPGYFSSWRRSIPFNTQFVLDSFSMYLDDQGTITAVPPAWLIGLFQIFQNLGWIPNAGVANTSWADLWTSITGIMTTINLQGVLQDQNILGTNLLYRIFDATLKIDTTTLAYHADQLGNVERVNLVIDSDLVHEGVFECFGQHLRQGMIRLQIPYHFETDEVFNPLDEIFQIHQISVQFSYGQDYTPCVLKTDTRNLNPITNEINDPIEALAAENDSALAAKPIGASFLNVGDIDIRCGWTTRGALTAALLGGFLGTIINFLLALGLTTLANLLGILSISLAAAMAMGPFFWFLVAALVVEIVLILWGVPELISAEIRSRIRNTLLTGEEDDQPVGAAVAGAGEIETLTIKEQLDQLHTLAYAGEGLAEALAGMAIKEAVEQGVLGEDQGLEADEVGRVRFRNQFWQIIHVSKDLVKILIRPPAGD